MHFTLTLTWKHFEALSHCKTSLSVGGVELSLPIEVNFTDGTSTTFEACERPHVVLDPTGRAKRCRELAEKSSGAALPGSIPPEPAPRGYWDHGPSYPITGTNYNSNTVIKKD